MEILKPDDTKYGCQNQFIKPYVIPAFAGIKKRFRWFPPIAHARESYGRESESPVQENRIWYEI